MGIDPQTHKPISFPTDQLESQIHSRLDTKILTNSSVVTKVDEVQGLTSTTIVESQVLSNPCVSTSSSSSSSNSNPIDFEDLEFLDFEWAYSNNTSNNDNGIGFWEDDFNSWDFLVGREDDEVPIFQESWPCGSGQ